MMEPETLIILLAEDDEGHATLVERNLKRFGIVNEIVRARDGRETLDYVQCVGTYASRQPNGPLLLLLDINMPRIDGLEVLRTLKQDPKACHIPILMLTTTDDAREVRRCYELGCSVYVTKPVDYEQFLEAVKRLGMFLSIVKMPREDEHERATP